MISILMPMCFTKSIFALKVQILDLFFFATIMKSPRVSNKLYMCMIKIDMFPPHLKRSINPK